MNQLKKLLTTDVVRLNQKVENWKEAIELSGDLLVKSGGIQPEYVTYAVDAATTMGAYFVVRPNVAISHARPGEGVNEVSVSLVTLDPPIIFGHPDNDPVSVLFMFATLDNESHIELLTSIARILEDDALIDETIEAKTFEAIQDVLDKI